MVSVETLKPVKPVPASQLATESDVDRAIKLVHSLLQELNLDGTRVKSFQVLEIIFPVLWIGIRIRMIPHCFGCRKSGFVLGMRIRIQIDQNNIFNIIFKPR